MQYCCSFRFWLSFLLLTSTITILVVRLYYFKNIQYFYYENERQNILNHDKWQQFGSSLILDIEEEKANRKLMNLKMLEYDKWQNNDTLSEWTGDVVRMRQSLEKSQLYQILRRMPKGAALHVRDKALANAAFLLELTYEKGLWLCLDAITGDYELLRFSLERPNSTAGYRNINCEWHLLNDLRLTLGSEELDSKLKTALTLSPLDKDPYEKLRKIDQLLKGLLTFAPVWHKYCIRAFEELHMDNVQILSNLPRLYDLEGNYLRQAKTLEVMRNISIQTSRKISTFFGSSLIYALPRNVNDSEFDMGLRSAVLLKLFYPKFFLGIDLVNETDLNESSRPLQEFCYRLLDWQHRLDYYLTSVQTDWHDDSIYEDIVESYLLNTRRTTFTKELLYHSYLLTKLIYKNIPIVINPTADQVFHKIEDLRDHPGCILFRHSLPLVVSSDYPAYWQVDPLTYDFYMVFMKMAPNQADLRLLKQLALNSINYSGMDNDKKSNVLNFWKFLWSKWIWHINHTLD